jgi:hypothetical protein
MSDRISGRALLAGKICAFEMSRFKMMRSLHPHLPVGIVLDLVEERLELS